MLRIWKPFKNKFGYETVLFIIIVCFHFVKGNGILEGCIISLLIFFLFTTSSLVRLDMEKFSFLLLGIYIFSFVTCLDDLIQSLYSNDYASGWVMIFNNANMASVFICCVFSSIWIFVAHKGIRLVTFILVIIGLLACKSRNAILFFGLANAFLYFKHCLVNRQKYLPILVFLFLITILYYMIVVEPYLLNISSFSVFGKTEGTTGRSMQILYIIDHFDINMWGYGSLINKSVEEALNYAVHNFYVSTIYSMGVIYFLFYLFFIYRLYFMLKSYESRIFLICFHVYFFFEPSWAFCVQMNYLLPMIIVMCSLVNPVVESDMGQKKKKYHTNILYN